MQGGGGGHIPRGLHKRLVQLHILLQQMRRIGKSPIAAAQINAQQLAQIQGAAKGIAQGFPGIVQIGTMAGGIGAFAGTAPHQAIGVNRLLPRDIGLLQRGQIQVKAARLPQQGEMVDGLRRLHRATGRTHRLRRCHPARPTMPTGHGRLGIARGIGRDRGGLDMKAFATAATPLFIRVAKGKTRFQRAFNKIHLRAQQKQHRLWVNQNR